MPLLGSIATAHFTRRRIADCRCSTHYLFYFHAVPSMTPRRLTAIGHTAIRCAEPRGAGRLSLLLPLAPAPCARASSRGFDMPCRRHAVPPCRHRPIVTPPRSGGTLSPPRKMIADVITLTTWPRRLGARLAAGLAPRAAPALRLPRGTAWRPIFTTQAAYIYGRYRRRSAASDAGHYGIAAAPSALLRQAVSHFAHNESGCSGNVGAMLY